MKLHVVSFRFIKIVSFIFFLIFLAFFLGSPTTASEPRDKFNFDGLEYTREDIAQGFLSVAFSDYRWSDGVYNSNAGTLYGDFFRWLNVTSLGLGYQGSKDRYEGVRKYKPWLVDYMYPPNGWPAHNVINKWAGSSVAVSIGWPAYAHVMPVIDNAESPLNQERGRPLYSAVEESVRSVIPRIQSATGMQIKFLSVDDPVNQTESYARIRIVLTSALGLRAAPRVSSYLPIVENDERALWGGVAFENADRLMEGYILPDNKNSIGLAVCKIHVNARPEQIYDLVSECLVRAMGLIGISGPTDLGVLSSSHVRGGQSSIGEAGLSGLSQYDQKMIQIMYCPVIKQGMTKKQVLEKLVKDQFCL